MGGGTIQLVGGQIEQLDIEKVNPLCLLELGHTSSPVLV